MMLTLHIDYHTQWGECLKVCGSAQVLGAGRDNFAAPMTPGDGDRWTLHIDIPEGEMPVTYHYIVVRDGHTVRREWGKGHTLDCPQPLHSCVVLDRWCDMPDDKPFYASAFTQCVCKRQAPAPDVEACAGKILFEAEAPMVAPGQVLAIAGSTPSLGAWDTAKAVRMSDARYPQWRALVDARDITAASEFKFVVLDSATGNVVAWEHGDNRTVGIDPAIGEATVLAGLRVRNPFHWKGAGVAIPVFALRSDEDFGVGDFYDLKKMIDWAAATGQRFVQILPVNDTTMTHTWMDSYPYNANSTFALHPMYLRLQELGTLADRKRRAHYEALGKELNALAQIDYERVNEGKIAFFHEIFAQEGQRTLASADYKAFVETNRSWLLPYAAFCVLRDRFGTPDFTQWPDGFDRYDAGRIERFAAANTADMDYVCYLQYHLDKQMRHVAAYARERGVAIKGDIPIGISRTSADAWQSPELFNMNSQAGAPPDDFSVLGQNWGFPTYNWDVMARDGYAWWKARFSKMSEYFDAYRIDHVLGFFRIWQIPMDAIHGLLGIFNPALPFTPDEMRSGYDFWINPDLHTRPYIMDWFLGDFFGELTDRVRNEYLIAEGYGRYRLKPEVDTQRKVADLFAGAADDASKRIRDGLMGLIDNVLFIEDPVERGKYHPRISAQHSYIYRSLNDYEKWCFDRLYNDFFYRRHDAFWHEKAMQKLPPLIGATDMLVCAEDLGMIPHCVPSVMHELEILSLEIQRMPKDPNTEFGNTAAYPYFSVCTTSTHDMGGIRQWWEEDRAATQRFYNQVLHESGQAPYFAEPWVCERIVRRHLESPSMLCILPWQDWMSIDGDLRRHDPREEQINVPANSRHYWRYRMHMKLEDLLLCDSLNDILLTAIRTSGR